MEDPAKVMVAVAFFGSIAYSVSAIARATVAHKKEERRLEAESVPPLTEARLARIEQAVDAIALEVERIGPCPAGRGIGRLWHGRNREKTGTNAAREG